MNIFKDLLPKTESRVLRSSSESVNERNRREIETNVARYAHASPAAISQRMKELDAEWDIERALEANAATVTLVSAVLALTVNRKWAWLTVAVGGFLLQHALQGWCPPLPILRRLGVRTTAEIHQEKMALKQLRGDYPPSTQSVHELVQ